MKYSLASCFLAVLSVLNFDAVAQVKSPATVTLSDLSYVYDGTAKSASATTDPEGLTVDLTYDGNIDAPTNAGSYEVIGTINDVNYEGAATNTMVIAQAPATVTLTNLSYVYDGTAKSASATTDPEGLTVDVTYDGNTDAPTNAGSYEVIGTINDVNYEGTATNTMVIAQAPATVTLTNLSYVYDGTAKSASATTDPEGLTVDVTYDGNTDAPTNAGSYEVIGTINDVNYEGTATNTMVIAKAAATITLTNLSYVYDGTAKSASATTDPEGLTVDVTYDGNTDAPTNAGSYEVIGTINDVNYEGTATNTMVIAKAAATITLTNLSYVYDGTAKSASATTDPEGLTVDVTYDGNTDAPTNAGSYEVIGTINDVNYEGTATNTMVIAKAAATITLTNLSYVYDGTAKSASATTDPEGLTVDVTYDGNTDAPTNAGSYEVIGTINNVNYEGAATNTMVIAKAAATITLTNLSYVYDGTAKSASATTDPEGLTVDVTYDGNTDAPTNAGSYEVIGTINNVNYEGAATNTMVIAKAAATITLTNLSYVYDGTAKSASATTDPEGLTVDVTYDGNIDAPTNAGSYEVIGTINDVNYEGTATNTMVIAKAAATITLTNLSYVYDGTAKSASATTDPEGLTVDVTYDGNTDAPTNAGSYEVIGTINDVNYEGAATNTMVIAKAAATITLTNLSYVYDGTAKSASATTDPEGLTVDVTYDGNIDAPTNAGSYEVIGTINDVNYEGTATNTMVIAKAAATITLTNLSYVYDGTAKSASATTDPEGLTVDVTYDGNTDAPTNAGSYEVIGTINNVNYEGAATNTMVIAKAAATITLTNLSYVYDGTAKSASATTVPGGLTVDLTYDGNIDAPTNVGSYEVIGTVVDANYVGTATNTLVIANAFATVTLGNLSYVYDGTAKSASATTDPEGLTVDVTYDGNTDAPTNAGSYEVIGTVVDANYVGAATNTMVIAKAAATITLTNLSYVYDGTAKSASATTDPEGLTVDLTYNGNTDAPTNAGSYEVVGTVVDANFAGITTNTMVVAKAPAAVMLGSLSQVYDGRGKNATATTDPAGLTVFFTYNGSPNAPTNAGSYEVIGTITDVNYEGTATDTLVIASAGLYTRTEDYLVGRAPKGIWLGNLRGNDTYRDMVVANSGDDTITVRLCLDNGTFGQANTYPVGREPVAVRTTDFNGDGFEDIAVANFGTNTVSVLINQGYGANFAPAANFVVGTNGDPNPGPCAINFADVNKDGRMDIIVANYNESTVSILTNTAGSGGHVFGLLTNYNVGRGPSSVSVADFNHDGIKDILTANKLDGTLTILPGQTNGTFGDPVTITLPDTNSGPVYALSGDLNGDGYSDIVVVNQNSGTVSILLADSTQPLINEYSVVGTYAVGTAPSSVLVRDLDGDGIADLAVANGDSGTISVLLGRGDGTFDPPVTFGVGNNPAVVVGSNFNGDRATDLAVANTGDNTVSILLFSGPLANNFTWDVLEDTPTNVVLQGSILSRAPLIYITNSLPTNGILNWVGTNLIYTPDPDFFGKDGFTYSVTDGSLTSLVANVTLSVLAVNDAPSFDLSTNYVVVKEDAAKTNITGFAINIQKGPTNEFPQTLSFIVTTTNNSFFSARPAISPSGVLSFRPAPNVTGSITVNAQLKDSGGTARGGTNLSPVQSFTIEVRPNPIKPLQGTYAGLFYDTNGIAHSSSGYFTFRMMASGAFSGTLIAEGISYPFAGLFDESGFAATEVVRNNSTLNVAMQLDMTNQSDTVSGSVVDAGTNWTAQLSGDRLVFDSLTNFAPQAGKYTMVIPGDTNSVSSPGGDGYAMVTVTSSGIIIANGRLGDGTSFSQGGAFVSKGGQWPLYASLYSANGSLLGWVDFTNAPEGNLQGEVSWIKTGLAGGKYYPNGFTNQVDLVGSTYTNPASGQRVLNIIDGTVQLQGDDVYGIVTDTGTLTDTNTVVVGDQTILTLTPSSGLMSGSFIHPTLRLRRSLKGVVLQQQNVVRGYFLGTNESGSMLFSSP